MIITEEIKIKDKFFTYTYSDKKVYIERDGVQYIDAIDPVFLGRTYTETEIPISEEIIETEE
jgi:hypothetical protein